MEVELKAGAKIDMLSPGELKDALGDFKTALLTGIQYKRVAWAGMTDASGAISTLTDIGPRPGYVWSIKRIVISVGGGNGGTAALSVNDDSFSNLVNPSETVPAIFTYSGTQLVLYPGDLLYVQGTGLVASSALYIAGQVEEVAVSEVGKL